MSDLVFEKTRNQESEINKSYDVSQEEVEEMIENIKNWLRQQPHLPAEEGDVFNRRLKYMLRSNKTNVEKTKKKLDMYYTVRNLFPEYFDNRTPDNPRIQQAMENYILCPVARPLDNFNRILFVRIENPSLNTFLLEDFLALTVNTTELRINFDLCVNDCFIFDFHNFTLAHYIKLANPFVLGRAYKIVQKAYSDRIVGMHFLHMSSYGQTLIRIIKSIVTKKLAERVYVHPDMESLHKHFPRDVLPSDYGGEGKPLLEMRDNWYKFMKDSTELIRSQGSIKANEKLRTGKQITRRQFEIYGII